MLVPVRFGYLIGQKGFVKIWDRGDVTGFWEDAHGDSELELCPTAVASVPFDPEIQDDNAYIFVRGGWRLRYEAAVVVETC